VSTAFLFPGQGSQHVGMGEELYRAEPTARAAFDQADRRLGFSLSLLCFQGPEAGLTDTVNQQPALFVHSIATLWTMRASHYPEPDFVAGHSLGELSALVAAGAIEFDAGLDLVRRRGELMKQAGNERPGAMAAVLALGVQQVAAICDRATEMTGRPVQVANDNCPGQAVISGDVAALELASDLALQAGARRVTRLPITIAAHSALMASAADDFARAVDATPVRKPDIPVIGNVSARPLLSPGEVRAELKAQLTSPVRWTDTINYLNHQGVDQYVEVGAGSVLLGLVKRIDSDARRIKWALAPAE
jgi:[acyl-carrier-protein] S-malonyltransferase